MDLNMHAMNVAKRFLAALAIWSAGILMVMIPIALLDDYSQPTTHFIRLIARAIGLAAFPAGLAVSPSVFRRAQPWPELAGLVVTAALVSVAVLLTTTVLAPLLDSETRTVPELIREMTSAGESWETRNNAAWILGSSLVSAATAFLHAMIGLQVGTWASRAFPMPIRRLLYWAIGLGLLISGYAVWDTTYETIVLHTQADVTFAAFYSLLVPLAICAGLMLPTFALFQRGELARAGSTS
jgi:hypothetical protein